MSLSPIIEKAPSVSVVKSKPVSNGVTVCQLNSGQVVLSAHEGERRVLVDLTQEELSDFVQRLSSFKELAEAYRNARPSQRPALLRSTESLMNQVSEG